MDSAMKRLSALVCVALLLGGCADPPVGPDEERASQSAQGGLTAPSNLTATAVSPSRVDLAWRDKSSSETGFDLQRSTTGPSGTFAPLTKTGANVTTYRNSGLSPSSQYCYRVRALRRVGSKTSYSAFSSTACTTTMAATPLAPINVYARPMFSFVVVVGWSDQADNEDGYRVERSPGSAGPWVTVITRGPMVGLHSQEATDVGLASEEQVCYRVVAFNFVGESASIVRCTTPPAAPTSLTANAVDNLSVELTWADNSAVEDGYEVVRGNSQTSVVINLPVNSSSYHDTGLTGNLTYVYRVQATKDGGRSSPSEIANAPVALLPPAAPTGARASPNGSTGVAVFWTDQSSNDDGFRVERSTDAGVTWVFAVEGQPVSAPWAVLTDSDRTPEFEVCYRVIAWNTAGQSSPSNTACTTPPAAPTDLVSTQVDAETFDLQWTDNSQVESGYELIAFGSLGDWFLIASLPPNSTTFRYDLGMIPPGYAGPVLAATNDGGYSDWVYPSSAEGTAAAQSRIVGRSPHASPGHSIPTVRIR